MKKLYLFILILFLYHISVLPNNFLSFIITCYNCKNTVGESVNSIYQQNLTIPFEVICTDDGSSDETEIELEKLQTQFKNLKIIKHHQNRGGGAARNTCVNNSHGNLIFCLDSDNVLEPNSINPLIQLLEDTGCEAASFEELRYFSGNFKHSHSWFFASPNDIVGLQHFIATPRTPGSSGNYLYTRSSFERAKGYSENRGALDAWGFAFRQHATGTKIAI